MSTPLLLDPFEIEQTLASAPRVLAFSPQGFEIPLDVLLRHLAFDIVGGIPRPLGEIVEDDLLPGFRYRLRSFHLGQGILALATEISDHAGEHRALELLGIGKDARVRLNLTRPRDVSALPPMVQSRVAAGWSLGQVRVWANDAKSEIRRVLSRQLVHAGVENEVLPRHVEEPVYCPPAAGRLFLDHLPDDDFRVVELLLQLVRDMHPAGGPPRPARRVGLGDQRVRHKEAIVSYRCEIHRVQSGVVHARRREVEAGVERPGLVRTFNVAGIGGAGRLRIRDVGGRASAEFAGTPTSIEHVAAHLTQHMGGRS
ncbi:MAG: hypothetical protein KDD82_01230 [Planctomycetes bacterium]|nr:hypothetical protein [Planctomycetota bacterium]